MRIKFDRFTPRGLVRAGLGLFLISPILIWLERIDHWSFLESSWLPELTKALSYSAVGTLLGVTVGLFFALSLVGTRGRKLYEVCLLAPSFVPPLFLILAFLDATSRAEGFFSVIALHTLIVSGLVAVAFARQCEGRVGRQAEAARVMGASAPRIWFEIIWPQLRGDVGALAFMAMALCLGSFSIPQLLGKSGGGFPTLETISYDLIRTRGQWGHALQLGLAVSVLFFILVPRRSFTSPTPDLIDLKFLRMPLVRGLIPIPALLLAIVLVRAMEWPLDAPTRSTLFPAALLSLALGLAVGLAHLVFFILIAFVSPHARFDRALVGLVAPGAILSAFAFLVIPGWPLVKYTAVSCVLTVPLLYRWQVRAAIQRLAGQGETARSLGAGAKQILFEVVWPQAGGSMLRAAGLAGAWASGEHALSGILLDDGESLPLLTLNLIEHYQLGSATACLLPIAGVTLFVYVFFVGAVPFVGR